MNNDDELALPNEAFEPIRKRVDVQVDNLVQCGGSVYRIAQVLDFETVIGIEVESGRSVPLRIGELRPMEPEDAVPLANTDISEIADEDWKIAETRYAAIKPLLNALAPGRKEVGMRAKEVGVNTATLYRWLNRYKAYEVITALIPKKRGWKPGNSRITALAEEVIEEVIQDYYLTVQRPFAQKAVTEVLLRCQQKGVDAPHPNTIRARLNKISEKEMLRKRGHREKAKNKFLPAAGNFPNVDFPLAVVQVDHSPADIIVVDDIHRKPIGRPWITLAMDLYSRMIT
ncbi:MAG: helix-turn-helix domain-containing protein, partial [Gammaproteobacteria bacterium]|nr:helix-turn-helix domain-containing protein [Gammaproteobacteria bacterium]